MRRSRRLKTLAVIAGLGAVATLSLGARCIENTSVQKDADGFTHIYGEMINETDIQGSQIVVHGRLLDGAGAPIAETDGVICPPTLDPHSQVVYDIRFPAPVNQAPASHDVRPIAGKALEAPLTDPQVRIDEAGAVRTSPESAFMVMQLTNTSSAAHNRLKGCLAVYDAQGKVVAAGASQAVGVNLSDPEDLDFNPTLRVKQRTAIAVALFEGVPATGTTARGWVWFEAPAAPGTTTFKYVMTNQVALIDPP